MRLLYRGCRLSDPDAVKKYGMKYYWETPRDAVADIIHTLERLHKLSKFKTNPWVRNYMIEGAGEGRIQLWAAENKELAESYARDTPELMMLVLSNIGFARDERRKLLDQKYGKPCVVTFEDDRDPIGNLANDVPCGRFIPAERIVAVDPVDVAKPDQFMLKLSAWPETAKPVQVVQVETIQSKPVQGKAY